MPVGFDPQRRTVVRAPVGFGSRKAARKSWGHPCAGGIWLGGGRKDGGDGGVCRWDLRLRMQPAPGRCWRPRAAGIWSTQPQRYRGAVVRVPVGFGSRKGAGVIRVPVKFGLAEEARMEVTDAGKIGQACSTSHGKARARHGASRPMCPLNTL